MMGMDPELIKGLFDLGGTVCVVGMMLIFAYKLFHKFGKDFIASQRAMADAMSSQAASMGGMRNSVELFISRDTMDHREILLSLQVVGKELVNVVESLSELNQKYREIETLLSGDGHERTRPDHQKKPSQGPNFKISCG